MGRHKGEISSPSLGRRTFGLELKLLRDRLDSELPVCDSYLRTTIDECGGDVVVAVRRILGLHNDRTGTTNCRGVNWEHRLELIIRSGVARVVGGCEVRH